MSAPFVMAAAATGGCYLGQLYYLPELPDSTKYRSHNMSGETIINYTGCPKTYVHKLMSR